MSRQKRFFSCECHHRLRFGVKQCSYCFRSVPIYNRWGFWLFWAIVLGIGLAIMLLPETFWPAI